MGINWKDKNQKSQYYKEYFLKNKEKRKNYIKAYYEANKEYIINKSTQWNKLNKEKAVKTAKKSKDKRRKLAKVAIDERISRAMRKGLSHSKNKRRWENLVGYTVEQLKDHLESKFTEGMTWEIFVTGTIHIDHIIPKSSFKYDTADDESFKKCWALSNLQPLWAKDNQKKSNKII